MVLCADLSIIHVGLDDVLVEPCVKIIDPDNHIIGSHLSINEVNQLADGLSTAVGDMLSIKHLIKKEASNEDHS